MRGDDEIKQFTWRPTEIDSEVDRLGYEFGGDYIPRVLKKLSSKNILGRYEKKKNVTYYYLPDYEAEAMEELHKRIGLDVKDIEKNIVGDKWKETAQEEIERILPIDIDKRKLERDIGGKAKHLSKRIRRKCEQENINPPEREKIEDYVYDELDKIVEKAGAAGVDLRSS